jgi:xanthine dehydrogenase YagR molybdenum-binding subunit
VIDYKGESAIVYASTQGTFSFRDGMSEALQLPEAKFEIRCEYVGGGFGAKFGPGKEGTTAAQVAAKYQRPVSLFVDRNEEHLDTGNRPSSRSKVKIGFKNDGTIVGGQVQTWGGVGVGRGGGVRFPSERYAFGEIQRGHEDVSFNAGGPRAMRAPGHPQGAFAEELMLDEIATIAGVDPLELRLRLDQAEERREMYRMGAEIIGWNQRQKTGSQKTAMRRGFGMGSCTWGAGSSSAEAEVIINRDGSVIVRTGTQDIGSGMRTVAGVLVADKLGVPLANVTVQIGSSNFPEGPASGGSVTTPNTAPVIADAALDARAQLLKAIADRAAVTVEDLTIVNGEVRHSEQKLGTWAEVCAKMPTDTIVGRGRKARNQQHPGEGNSHGAQFVALDVDSETGVIRVNRVIAIQSCGRVVCRKTAESQIIGGVIQGISYALFENRILDRVTGAMVNPNLEMYKILGSADMPHIEPILWDKGQTGVRSLGEPPGVPTAAAVACAVFNAIGVPVRHLPLTPDKVLTAIDAAQKGGAA